MWNWNYLLLSMLDSLQKKIRTEFMNDNNNCTPSLNNLWTTRNILPNNIKTHGRPEFTKSPAIQFCKAVHSVCEASHIMYSNFWPVQIQKSFPNTYYLDLHMHMSNKNRHIEFPLTAENKTHRIYEHIYPWAKWDSSYWPQCRNNRRQCLTLRFTLWQSNKKIVKAVFHDVANVF
jgi:hypothetical protein